MQRDTIVFSVCSFLLGLTIGSLLIGPHLARGGQPPPALETAANPMNAVRERIAQLNAAIARDPRNFDALAQLGAMYMDAAKFPQAIGYFERALAVRDDPALRADLATCYYNEAVGLAQAKRFDEARALLPRLQQLRPDDPDVQRLAQALSQPRP
jgi:tetratricopeptide (TPR) repeat protein